MHIVRDKVLLPLKESLMYGKTKKEKKEKLEILQRFFPFESV